MDITKLHCDCSAHLFSAISVIDGKVDKLLEIINGTNGCKGLKTEIDRNTQFRLNLEEGQSSWKRVIPSIITGICVGLIMLIFNLFFADDSFGKSIEEIWLSGSLQQKAENSPEWEISLGSGSNKLLFERELTDQGIRGGWGYDLKLKKRTGWLLTSFSDVYRQTQDISLQTHSMCIGKNFRLGAALAGEAWRDWTIMGALEIDYREGWVDLHTQYLTDLSDYRWEVNGGMQVPLSPKLAFGPVIDYQGTEDVTIGSGKLKIVYKL